MDFINHHVFELICQFTFFEWKRILKENIYVKG
jgi:hypothetical protein